MARDVLTSFEFSGYTHVYSPNHNTAWVEAMQLPEESVAKVEVGRQLEMSRVDVGEASVVRLAGAIDGTIETAPILEPAATEIVFDLDEVDRVTSFGIREWMKLLQQLDADYYCFVRCRPALVAQFNMVANFGADGQLITFYLPYYCVECDDEFDVLVDLRSPPADLSDEVVPAADCPTCGADGEFDDLVSVYLDYVNAQAPLAAPGSVERLIDGKRTVSDPQRGQPPAFRLKKEVVGEVTALWLEGRIDRRARLERQLDGLEGRVVAICADIQGTTPEGLERLERLVSHHVMLARVRPEFLDTLHGEASLRQRADLATLLVPAHCPDCDWSGWRDIQIAGLLDPSAPDTSQRCGRCEAKLDVRLSNARREALRDFITVVPPHTVETYLAQRPNGPADGDLEVIVGHTFGRYTLDERIGKGGMADIFLARQTGAADFERQVVIKRLRPEHTADRNLIDSFVREARLAAQLNHPNIVQVTDFGQTNEFYYIAMEYVDGPDLREVIKAVHRCDRAIPPALAVYLTARICEALHCAHTMTDAEGTLTPIIHQDVSPHNILLSSYGTPKLTDFGIAGLASKLGDRNRNIVRGKMAYLAPETVDRSLGPIDARADVFSLGTVLYECLTSRVLFRRSQRRQTMRAVLTAPTPRVSSTIVDAPEALDRLLERALAKNPAERYQTARQFGRDLETILDELDGGSQRELSNWVARLQHAATLAPVGPGAMSSPSRRRSGVESRDVVAPPRAPTEQQTLQTIDTAHVIAFDDLDGADSPGSASDEAPQAADSVAIEARQAVDTRVLLIEGDGRRLAMNIAKVVRTAVDQVDIQTSPDDLDAICPADYELILVNYDALSRAQCATIFEAFDAHKRRRRLLMYSSTVDRDQLAMLFGGFGLANLLARNDEEIDREELLTTIQKILRDDIFGIDKYFPWGAGSRRLSIGSTDRLQEVVDVSRDFLDDLGVSRRLVGNFSLVTEELVTNALYDAPVDDGGQPRYAHLSRAQPVNLAAHEQVSVTFCSDGRRAGLSVADPFGSLSVDGLLSYLTRCFEGIDQINWETGGAGLGLFQSFEGLSHFIVNLDPGEHTEVIGLLDIQNSYPDFARKSKSLNVFLAQ